MWGETNEDEGNWSFHVFHGIDSKNIIWHLHIARVILDLPRDLEASNRLCQKPEIIHHFIKITKTGHRKHGNTSQQQITTLIQHLAMKLEKVQILVNFHVGICRSKKPRNIIIYRQVLCNFEILYICLYNASRMLKSCGSFDHKPDIIPDSSNTPDDAREFTIIIPVGT